MTKEAILTEIRRVAGERNGRIGLRAFVKATGIPEKQILGKHWATWNEAVADAGIETSTFARVRTPEESALEAFAQLATQLKTWPTENQLSLARRRDPGFPSLSIFRRLRSAGDLPARLLKHCADRSDLATANELATAQVSSTAPQPETYDRAPVQGHVYMLRSGRRYKIGRTNSPTRRHREVRLDLPDPTHLVHSIETDDPSGIEAYWHRRFEAKRVRDTEFFNLDAADVAAFKMRKYQ